MVTEKHVKKESTVVTTIHLSDKDIANLVRKHLKVPGNTPLTFNRVKGGCQLQITDVQYMEKTSLM